MKLSAAIFLGLQGAAAFPGVLNTLEKRATGQSGCSTSSKCNQQYAVSDSQVIVNPAAQAANAKVPNCGALTPCATFSESQKGE